MNPVEDALIRRLDARRALANALGRENERNRAILVDLWRSGCTYRETGERFGLSNQRVAQIHQRGFHGLEQALKEKPRRQFDKVAFLEHMRKLIRLRDEESKKLEWDREMAVMSHFVKLATPIPRPPPPPPPVVSYPGALPVWTAPTNVEPWFDPKRTPTPDDVKQIELYATNYFAAALIAQHRPIGGLLVSPIQVVCARNADAIAAKLYCVASVRMPGHFSHMSVSSEADGKEVSIDIWFRRT